MAQQSFNIFGNLVGSLPQPEEATPAPAPASSGLDVFGSPSQPQPQPQPQGLDVFGGQSPPAQSASGLDVFGAPDPYVGTDFEEGVNILQHAFETNELPSYEAAPQQIKNVSAAISRLYQYGILNDDKDAITAARRARTMAADIIPKDIAKQYGLDQIPFEEEPGLLKKGFSWVGGKVLLPALEVLNRPFESVGTAIGMSLQGKELEGAMAFMDGITFGKPAALLHALGLSDLKGGEFFEYAKNKLDKDEDDTINFREVLGIDPEAGGRLAGFFDTVAIALFDPLTWVTLGQGSAAKAGLASVAATQGDDVARAVAREGIQILDKRALSEVKHHLTEAIAKAQAARKAGFWERLGLRSSKDVAERVDHIMNTVLDGGVGHINVAGRNLRVNLLDDFLYHIRPGFGTKLSRFGEAGRGMFSANPEERFEAAQKLFGKVAEVDDVPERLVGDEFLQWKNSPVHYDIPVSNDATEAVITRGTILSPKGEPVGAVERTLMNDGSAFLDVVSILPDYQGKGYASRFLKREVDKLGREGFHTIRLTAVEDGPLVWGRRGFVIDTTRQKMLRNWLDDLIEQVDRRIAETPEPKPRQLSLFDAIPEVPETGPIRNGMIQSRTVLKHIRDKLVEARANPTAAAINSVIDPSSDSMRALSDIIKNWGAIPMVRGLKAKDALRVIDGGERLGQRLAGTKVGKTFGALFRPRSALQQKLGDYAEEVFDKLRVTRESSVAQKMQDMALRLVHLADEAAKEVGSLEEADNYVRRALELADKKTFVAGAEGITQGLDPYAIALREADNLDRAGLPAVADYLRSTAAMREEVDKAAVRGGLEPERLRQAYFPRILTDDARKLLLEQGDEIISKAGLNPKKFRGAQGRFENPRTYFPELPLDQVNRKLAKLLNVPPDTKLFEDRVLAAFATRGDAAYRSAADMDMIEAMTKEFIGEGAERAPMVVRVPPGGKVPKGYRSLNDISGEYYARIEIANEIERMHGFFTNNEMLNKISEGLENWSRTWGSYATAPLIDGIGFHSRNVASNVMLNATAGIVSPAVYEQAVRVQRDMARVFNHMKKTGKPFEEAMRAVGISEADQTLFKQIRDHGIVGEQGWFTELAGDQAGRKLRKYNGVWDFLLNNAVIRSGRAFGRIIEDNARIAHYIGKLQEGLPPELAARSVRKFLFDYGDLTGAERWLRKLSRFYTFMRKNAAVQLWAIAHAPGRVNAIQRATGGGLAGALGLAPGLPGAPDYSRERGDMLPFASGGLSDILLGSPGDRPALAGSFDTPFQAFTENFYRPIVQLGLLLQGDGEAKGLVGSLLDLTAGGQRSFADNVYTTISNYNPSFQRPLSDRERGAEAVAMRWFDSLIGPAWSQIDRFVGRLTEGKGIGPIGNNVTQGTQEMGHEMLLLSNILGLNVAATRTKEKEDRDTLFLLDEELQNMLDNLRHDGIDVPQIDDLRKAGIIPEKPESTRRARSVILQEDIDRLEGLGLPTDKLRSELSDVLAVEAEQGYQIDPETGEYTTRAGRTESLAAKYGLFQRDDNGEIRYDEDGNPLPITASSTLARVLWNKEHPEDPYVKEDGTPYSYVDLSPVWPTATDSEVRDWLIEKGATKDGAPITSRTYVNQEMRDAYNEAHPDRPALTLDQRIAEGVRPISGVGKKVRNGQVVEYIWPEGMSEDNWWIVDPYTGDRLSPSGAAAPSSSGNASGRVDLASLFGS